jgi:hypothetical protein
LIVGNVAARVCGYDVIDFIAGVFSAVAFISNEVNGAHGWKMKCEPNIRGIGRQRERA